MSTFKKLKKESSKKQKTHSIDYLDEVFLSEITDENDQEELDQEDNFDGEMDYDNNIEMNDYIETENLISEENVSKQYLADNSMVIHNSIILSLYLKKVLKILNLQEDEDSYTTQKIINQYLEKTRNKSLNDEIILTAIVVFQEYHIGLTLQELIDTLVSNRYLKSAGMNTSSFINMELLTNNRVDITALYNIIFKNVIEFVEKISGIKTTIKNEIQQRETRNIRNVHVFDPTDYINPPMNPNSINPRNFPPELFTELQDNMSNINLYTFAPMLNHFVQIINNSGRALTIDWSLEIVPVQNKQHITNIPIIIRNLISVNMKKFSKFTKSDLISVLIENQNLIKNIKNFYKFLKVYNEQQENMRKLVRSLDKMKLNVDNVKNETTSNLFIKKRRIQ
jgi:hypothetical protein